MKKLEKEFKFRNNTYVQLEEGNNYYLYGVWNLKDEAIGKPSYYEIFKKKVAKAVILKGIDYPTREVYPNDDDFGSTAWCCRTIEEVDYIKQVKNAVLGVTV